MCAKSHELLKFSVSDPELRTGNGGLNERTAELSEDTNMWPRKMVVQLLSLKPAAEIIALANFLPQLVKHSLF